MANNIVQLKDYNDNNIYPIAGAAAQGSITKTMLDEGVFVGAELSDPGNIAYVGTSDIQDNAITTAKIADLNITEGKLASNSVTTSKIADGSVTSDKIDYATYTSSEQVIGKWINGKTIYRRVYEGVSLSNETIVANLYSITAIRLEAFYYNSDGFTQPIGQGYGTSTSRVFYDKSGSALKIQATGGLITGFSARVIIEYTKD